MTDTAATPKTPWLRYAVFALAALQLAGVAFFWADFLLRYASMDMLTRSMNRDFGLLFMVPIVLLTIPALVLAIRRRWLVLALILAILPLAAVVGFIALINFRSPNPGAGPGPPLWRPHGGGGPCGAWWRGRYIRSALTI